MIQLLDFGKGDFSRLIDAIPDDRFLLRWGGPQYTYPLTASQLNGTLISAIGARPVAKAFKAVLTDTGETVGHVQLTRIDHTFFRCSLGRVLIFAEFRGCGYGRAMVRLAIDYAANRLKSREISLNVFDFNQTAFSLYTSLGFREEKGNSGIRKYKNERWRFTHMRLNVDDWS